MGMRVQAHTAASKQPLEAYERFAEARIEEVGTPPCRHTSARLSMERYRYSFTQSRRMSDRHLSSR